MNKAEKADLKQRKRAALKIVIDLLTSEKSRWYRVKNKPGMYQNDHALIILYRFLPLVYIGYFGIDKYYGPIIRRKIKKNLREIFGRSF
ncbi:MAG TPA: hypothetical protein VMC41_04405 [Candidatus Nanoarchaeia archaeon]|nr:hypothetical protein [Candidatus Nanoarchaeia archaeon]